jgi:esterase FrsA
VTTTTVRFRRRLLVTACAATGTTEFATRRLGAGVFLPALFTQRYANMGGLDPVRFGEQMRACRSFEDARWGAYWDEIACDHLRRADALLAPFGEQPRPSLEAWLDAPDTDARLGWLAALVAPCAELLADQALRPTGAEVAAFVEAHDDPDVAERAPAVAQAVGELLQAITYLQVGAFPGGSPQRMRAYARSRRLFDALALAFADGLPATLVEQVAIEAGADTVHGYLCLPAQDEPAPTVLVTNGLEGTVQELLVPLLRYHASGLGVFVMEMPGSYAYVHRMSGDSEYVYRRVIDTLHADPRVDSTRLGIVGVSFGGYWAARMAAADRRLACAVASGAPTDHSFRPKLGLPEVILEALSHVTGAKDPITLLRRLRALSLRGRYAEITQPLLVINGDRDTLLSTQDSIDLAAGSPRGELLLYPGDDHCAMGHYREWLDASQAWLAAQLLDRPEVRETVRGATDAAGR